MLAHLLYLSFFLFATQSCSAFRTCQTRCPTARGSSSGETRQPGNSNTGNADPGHDLIRPFRGLSLTQTQFTDVTVFTPLTRPFNVAGWLNGHVQGGTTPITTFPIFLDTIGDIGTIEFESLADSGYRLFTTTVNVDLNGLRHLWRSMPDARELTELRVNVHMHGFPRSVPQDHDLTVEALSRAPVVHARNAVTIRSAPNEYRWVHNSADYNDRMNNPTPQLRVMLHDHREIAAVGAEIRFRVNVQYWTAPISHHN